MRYTGKQADPFYSSGPWRSVRVLALQRDLGLCQDCVEQYMKDPAYKVKTATMVHHKIPRKERPDLELCLDNLVSLCDLHHEQYHPDRGNRQQLKPKAPAGVRVVKI